MSRVLLRVRTELSNLEYASLVRLDNCPGQMILLKVLGQKDLMEVEFLTIITCCVLISRRPVYESQGGTLKGTLMYIWHNE